MQLSNDEEADSWFPNQAHNKTNSKNNGLGFISDSDKDD